MKLEREYIFDENNNKIGMMSFSPDGTYGLLEFFKPNVSIDMEMETINPKNNG